MAEEISKEILEEEIEKHLKDADLNKTSIKKVIQALEKKLGVELRSRKEEIDKIVMNHINSIDSDEESTKKEEEDMDSDEEPKKARGGNKKKPKAKVSEDEKESGSDSDLDEKPRITRGSNTRKKPATPKAKAPKRAGAGKGKGTGFTRAYKLSPQLSELMGADEMPRHAVVKRIWAIVKEKQLYDPNNKQFAICDDSLFNVIGKQRFRVFGMMKYLKTHFLID